MTHVAIVGGGQAAASVSTRLRALGFDGRISIYCAEGLAPYERPPLTKKFLAGVMPEADLAIHPTGTYPDRSIVIHKSTPVTAVAPATRTFTVDGQSESYDHLVLATGASARRLPTAIGGTLEGVYVIRTMADATAIRNAMKPGMKLLIIGGGYVGLEAAATATELGLTVTVVESGIRILQRVASPSLSEFVRAINRARGVEIIEGAGVDHLLGDKSVIGALLSNGSKVSADLVLIGIGAEPNTNLARAAGIAIDNGIQTDARGRTSTPGVWAAGDCTSLPRGNRRIRLESVQNAIDQAEVVAANIMGMDRAYVPIPTFWSEQYDNMVQIAGLGSQRSRIFTRPGGTDNAVSFWQYLDGRLLAVEAVNDAKTFSVARRLISDGKSPAPERVVDPAINLKSLLRV